MNVTHTIFILMVLNFSITGIAQSSNSISIKFIGNCALHLTDGNSNIYIDFPYKSGAHNYMEYDESELNKIPDNSIFIFTHKHADHFSGKLLRKLKGQKFNPHNISDLSSLNQSIPDFSIQFFKTPHKVFGISFKHYSYLLTWHGKKIYISGDTGELNDLSKMQDLEWAFVNPWLYMNAKNEGIKIDAKNIGVYHLYADQKIPDEVPSHLLFLKNQGEIIEIPF